VKNLSQLGIRVLAQSKLYLHQNGPTILTGVGVVGFGVTVVLAVKASRRGIEEMDNIKDDLGTVEKREIKDEPDTPEADRYTQSDRAKDYSTIIVNGTKTLAVIYGPAIIAGGISLTCFLTAHGMLRKQNAQLVAAYAALDVAFKAYRRRVAEEIGEDKEREVFWRGNHSRSELDEEGRPCVINEYGVNMPSPYARFFDESCREWNKTPEYNLFFLRTQQQYANDLLQARGHLFLNEVYDMLGMERSQVGQLVGWKMNEGGDNCVDFGIYEIADEVSRAFVNGHERVIQLDFNVDGVIRI
jgi:Family of unknown function (DUF6353)